MISKLRPTFISGNYNTNTRSQEGTSESQESKGCLRTAVILFDPKCQGVNVLEFEGVGRVLELCFGVFGNIEYMGWLYILAVVKVNVISVHPH